MRALLMLLLLTASSAVQAGEWNQLPPLPDKEGFAGSFAGVSNGALIFAGGANFPEKKPWEGGKKVWYDSVFVLEKPDREWKNVGTLPRALGYGVSLTHGNGIVCVGGSDAERHYSDVFRLEWKEGKLTTIDLPPLPKPLANTCGALVGEILYIAGGQQNPDSHSTLKTAWNLDLSATELKWKEIDACPGAGRMLSVAAGYNGAFWIVGGVDLVVGDGGKIERQYLKDAYRYDTDKGWKRVADLPYPVVAAPSPAPADASGFYVLGGDDGSQVGADPQKHRGFSKKTLLYDMRSNEWNDAGELSAPRVTAPCVFWHSSWVVLSGEMRPGVRSPQVWSSALRNAK